MRPSTGAGGEVAATRVPLNVGNTVMVSGTNEVQTTSPLDGGILLAIIGVQVKVPELKLRLA